MRQMEDTILFYAPSGETKNHQGAGINLPSRRKLALPTTLSEVDRLIKQKQALETDLAGQ